MSEEKFHWKMKQAACDIDLERVVYDGDRGLINDLCRDNRFYSAAAELLGQKSPYHSRKELLKRGLRLTPRIAPAVHEIGQRAAELLGLKPRIEFYVYQDLYFNAACYPPDEDRLYIMITSALLEKFSEAELSFVIGHEIGHYLFNHHEMPISYLLENGKDEFSPLHAIKLYAWARNAEISADRIGLLCAGDFDAATGAFFKLSSGVTDDSLSLQLADYVEQFRELENEIRKTEDVDTEDWYSTHPFSPMRIKALDVFVKSETFARLTGHDDSSCEYSEEEMESEVQRLMSLMEPSYLHEGGDSAKLMREFIFTAGVTVAVADGVVDDSEVEALTAILGEGVSVKNLDRAASAGVEKLLNQLAGKAEKLNLHLPITAKLNMIRDLVVIAHADGNVDDVELEVVAHICDMLQIRRDFINHVLGTLGREFD